VWQPRRLCRKTESLESSAERAVVFSMRTRTFMKSPTRCELMQTSPETGQVWRVTRAAGVPSARRAISDSLADAKLNGIVYAPDVNLSRGRSGDSSVCS
jgi:hypothetical protein